MVRQLFEGLKIRIAIEVQGKVVETNSPFVENGQVTLLNIDFDEVFKTISDPAGLQSLMGRKPASLAEVQLLMKELMGIQAPLVPEIRIEFVGN